jgi:RNA polymerase sigma-70 factor (ECF subfamily)
MSPDERSRRFTALYDGHLPLVLGYALRRTDPATAQDLVAEVFLVVWRRLEEVPVDAAPWLLSVARNQLAGMRRVEARQVALQERVRTAEPRAEPPPAVAEDVDPELMQALKRLPETDRELLCLLAWEGLDRAATAQVLGVSRAALRLRLLRARRRLGAELERMESDESAAPSEARARTEGTAWARRG